MISRLMVQDSGNWSTKKIFGREQHKPEHASEN